MKFWIKFYTEILDDEKMGMLSDRLWRRTGEMFLLAGYVDEGGLLPPLRAMAWRLRVREEDLETDLIELARLGLLNQIDGEWHVTNFEKRQAPSTTAERQQAYRERKRTGNKDVTKRYAEGSRTVTPEKRREEENQRRGESEKSLPLPRTPLEASTHPDIMLFHKVSGVFPGMSDYREIIDAATLLRRAHPDETELESYLLPFWLRWQGMKRKDGKAVNLTNPAWFVEWAVGNYTPPPAPEKVPVPANGTKTAIANMRAKLQQGKL